MDSKARTAECRHNPQPADTTDLESSKVKCKPPPGRQGRQACCRLTMGMRPAPQQGPPPASAAFCFQRVRGVDGTPPVGQVQNPWVLCLPAPQLAAHLQAPGAQAPWAGPSVLVKSSRAARRPAPTQPGLSREAPGVARRQLAPTPPQGPAAAPTGFRHPAQCAQAQLSSGDWRRLESCSHAGILLSAQRTSMLRHGCSGWGVNDTRSHSCWTVQPRKGRPGG